MAHYCYIGAEWVVFLLDVKLLGVAGKLRFYTNYKPCNRCGWSNINASDYTDKKEKEQMKALFYYDKINGKSLSKRLKDEENEELIKQDSIINSPLKE